MLCRPRPGLCWDPTACRRFPHLAKINPRPCASDICLHGVQPAVSPLPASRGSHLCYAHQFVRGMAREDSGVLRENGLGLAVPWNPDQPEERGPQLWGPQPLSSAFPALWAWTSHIRASAPSLNFHIHKIGEVHSREASHLHLPGPQFPQLHNGEDKSPYRTGPLYRGVGSSYLAPAELSISRVIGVVKEAQQRPLILQPVPPNPTVIFEGPRPPGLEAAGLEHSWCPL